MYTLVARRDVSKRVVSGDDGANAMGDPAKDDKRPP
jgi:hypothetical protein